MNTKQTEKARQSAQVALANMMGKPYQSSESDVVHHFQGWVQDERGVYLITSDRQQFQIPPLELDAWVHCWTLKEPVAEAAPLLPPPLPKPSTPANELVSGRMEETFDFLNKRLRGVIDDVLDDSNGLNIKRAEVVGRVSQVLINGVKAEIDIIRIHYGKK